MSHNLTNSMSHIAFVIYRLNTVLGNGKWKQLLTEQLSCGFLTQSYFSLIHLQSVSRTSLPPPPRAPLLALTWRSHLVWGLDHLLQKQERPCMLVLEIIIQMWGWVLGSWGSRKEENQGTCTRTQVISINPQGQSTGEAHPHTAEGGSPR